MKNLKLSTKLYLSTGLLIAVAIVTGVVGIVGLRQTKAGLDTVYNDRVVPLKQLKIIADDYAVAIVDAANKANAGRTTAEETLKGVNDASVRIQKTWKAYMATALTPDEVKLAAEAEQLYVPADAAVEKLRAHLAGKTGNLKGTLAEFDGPLYDQIDPISGKITELVDLQLRVAEAEYQAAHKRYATVLWLCIGALALGVTVGGGWGWRVSRGVSRDLSLIANELAAGADETAAASGQVSSASQALAEAASEQAASIEETSASLEEISAMTKRNAENSGSGIALGKQARDSATVGLERLGEMSRTLVSIKSAVGEMQAAVSEMQSSSQEISKIIKTIDEIAFQTNLLALNAAVEAARAGEAGAGFAVVADEVRALAQRSAQAARDTSEKIEAAVKRSELGGVASAKVVTNLGEVEATAANLEQVFNGIVNQIKALDEVISEIAAASKEQSQGVGEVNMAVGQMDKVTQSNAAAAEECAASSEELNAQAEVMKGTVITLQQLVGSATASPATSAAPARSTPRPAAPRPVRPPAPAPKKARATAPAHAPAGGPGDGGIPMPGGSTGGGFQDF